MAEDKKAVVFGSSGFIGSKLTGQLAGREEFDSVVAVNRRPLPGLPDTVREVINDLSDTSSLASLFPSAHIFVALGTTLKKAGSREAFRVVDYELPVALAELARDYPALRFLMVSSVGADSTSASFYLKTKGQAEEKVREILGEKAVFFRPSILMGERDEFRFSEEAGKAIMRLLGPLFVGPLARYRGVEGEDVARAMIEASLMDSPEPVYESEMIARD
jgi:uncharacterized protein YbjT (DUF2867 family)